MCWVRFLKLIYVLMSTHRKKNGDVDGTLLKIIFINKQGVLIDAQSPIRAAGFPMPCFSIKETGHFLKLCLLVVPDTDNSRFKLFD